MMSLHNVIAYITILLYAVANQPSSACTSRQYVPHDEIVPPVERIWQLTAVTAYIGWGRCAAGWRRPSKVSRIARQCLLPHCLQLLRQAWGGRRGQLHYPLAPNPRSPWLARRLMLDARMPLKYFRCTSDLKLQLTCYVHATKQHTANVPNQHIHDTGHGDAMGRAAGAPAACGLAATADAGR